MLIFQKLLKRTRLLASSKNGIYKIQLTVIFIFFMSISFVLDNIFSEESKSTPQTTQENIEKFSPAAQLFSEQNLSNNIISPINPNSKNSDQNILNNAFLKNDLEIFGFDTNTQIRNPIDQLSLLIKEMYSPPPPLLNITQEINTSIFQTFDQLSIPREDILFAENAIRLTLQDEPYPFITLALSKRNSQLPYFKSQKEKKLFTSTLSKNIAKRNFSRNTIKLVDEKQFIYITFNNIISHVIRLEPRKERMTSFNNLKKDNFHFTLIIDDVGENFPIARKLMDLPFPVILSIWPQSTHGTRIATLAHEKGLPVFLHQPMEPMSNKNYTPSMGIGGLKTSMSQEEMTQVLQRNMLSVPYLRGINNHMGSKFTTNPKAVNTLLFALKDLMPHILIIDSLTHNKSFLYSASKKYGFLTGKRNYFIDNNKGKNISEILNQAYHFAKDSGHAYVIGHARQNTLNKLLIWNKYKDKNILFTLPNTNL